MEHQAICVGGPFAGRRVDLPRDCRVLQIPQWPRAGSVLRAALGRESIFTMAEASTYRWHRSEICGPEFRFTSYALVHESMSNPEADRAAFIAALTASLAFFAEQK